MQQAISVTNKQLEHLQEWNYF